MSPADLIFVVALIATAIAVIVPLARAALGNAYDAELKRQHVDSADQANEPFRRMAWEAHHRSRRQRTRS